ncbi:MAG TPA: hypothetical protein VMW34_12110 [Anaerolineales bacterium]|nr:hypothetical protein [Anaerolineales bacterium]
MESLSRIPRLLGYVLPENGHLHELAVDQQHRGLGVILQQDLRRPGRLPCADHLTGSCGRFTTDPENDLVDAFHLVTGKAGEQIGDPQCKTITGQGCFPNLLEFTVKFGLIPGNSILH